MLSKTIHKASTKFKQTLQKIIDKTPDLKVYLDFGILPVINASFITILLTFFVYFFAFKLKQGKELILSTMESVDPFVSTFLIFVFCLINLEIYILKKKIIYETDSVHIESKYPKSLDFFNICILFISPLIYWVVILITDFSNPKIVISLGYFKEHITSVIMCIIYVVIYYIIVAKIQKKKIIDNQVPETESIDSKIFTIPNYSFVKILGKILFFIVLTGLIISFIENETKETISKYFLNIFQNHKFINYINIISIFVFIMGIIFFYFSFIKIKNKKSLSFLSRDYLILLLSSLIVLFILFFVFIHIGTIRPFDTILLFTISLRIILYVVSWIFQKVNFLIGQSDFKNKFLYYFALIVLIFGFTFLFLWVSFSSKYRGQFDLTNYTISEDEKDQFIEDRKDFSAEVSKWIKKRNNNEPIYLVSGQGGGSRAGCTFFMAMNRLDQVDSLFRNNLLAITTVSGSSNGAAFYLGSRYTKESYSHNIIKDSITAKNEADTIYKFDFISKPLFKMLFTDNFFVDTTMNRENRNEALISLESSALDSILNNKRKGRNLFKYTYSEAYSKYPKMPIFIPITFNTSRATKAIASPLILNGEGLSSFFSIFDSSGYELSIGESVSLSEAFPIISASPKLEGDSYIDGGAYDNLGFETLNDLYTIVKNVRDTLNPSKKIILVSIENSNYKSKNNTFKSEYDVIINSALNSIFISNPSAHYKLLKERVDGNHDKIIPLKIYGKKDQDIVLSRFLTIENINSINSWVNESVENFSEKQSKYIVYFDFDKSDLVRETIKLLNGISKDLKKSKEIILTGYCDKIDASNKNEDVRNKRIEKIKDYLVDELEINEGKIKTINNSVFIGVKNRLDTRYKDRKVTIELK